MNCPRPQVFLIANLYTPLLERFLKGGVSVDSAGSVLATTADAALPRGHGIEPVGSRRDIEIPDKN
jgi:hypothetical protein